MKVELLSEIEFQILNLKSATYGNLISVVINALNLSIRAKACAQMWLN